VYDTLSAFSCSSLVALPSDRKLFTIFSFFALFTVAYFGRKVKHKMACGERFPGAWKSAQALPRKYGYTGLKNRRRSEIGDWCRAGTADFPDVQNGSVPGSRYMPPALPVPFLFTGMCRRLMIIWPGVLISWKKVFGYSKMYV
jgi:hypothetical protein